MLKKPSSMKLPSFTIESGQNMIHGQSGHSDRTPFNECDQLSQPAGKRMSFLSVPSTPPSRRPSTADVVIRKLRLERMEGGGLSISGIALAANCHLTLIIFGAFFLLAGLVLSYMGFSDTTGQKILAQAAGGPHGTFKKANTHRQMQVIGPVFIIAGLLMIILGFSMYAIGRKIRLDEKYNRATVSAMQLRQLECSFIRDTHNCSPMHTFSPQINDAQPVLSLRRGSWWIEPAPLQTPPVKAPMDQPPPYSQNCLSELPNEQDSPRTASPPLCPAQPETQDEAVATLHKGNPLHTNETAIFSDAFCVASFPVKFDQTLDLAGRRHSTTSNSSIPSISPASVFEVQECPENEVGKNQTSFEASPIHNKNDYNNKTNKSDVEEREEPSLLHVQVPSTSIETAVNLTTSPSNVASNLPLSKNGVALPRLSRHSISSRGDIST